MLLLCKCQPDSLETNLYASRPLIWIGLAVRSKSQALKQAAEQYMKHMRETSFNFLVHTYTIYKQCSVCFDTGSQAYLIYVTTISTGCIKNLAKCKIFHLERENCCTPCKIFHTVLSNQLLVHLDWGLPKKKNNQQKININTNIN